MATHDNNMPVVFIAALDVIDWRDALIEADMDENTRLFNVLAEELRISVKSRPTCRCNCALRRSRL
ncbi:hypothetical protein [Primorskyibacter marinus]|uniref:hypothetical protein n=1 Tax=Primorskyibacter marinus TaxID=1977320 RepID=UPI00130018B7|nr:hypothetical protein [Primorskyibacter marinus]